MKTRQELFASGQKARQIVFALPVKDLYPIGGYKIAYQYADFLSSKGYDVHLVYSHVRYSFFEDNHPLFLKIKTALGFFAKLALKKYRAGEWFSFGHRVTKHFVLKFDDSAFRKFPSDAIFFATAVETAYPLASLRRFSKKNMFYLIQDYEKWHENTDEYLRASYRLGLHNIVIATWLQKIVRDAGSDADFLPNGLDFSAFYLTKDIASRNPNEVLLLNHKDERKGVKYALKALENVKKHFPDLHVSMFGNPERPENLPDWFTYYRTPEHEVHLNLYNSAAIFVSASLVEGWGLTVCEAMQCGCAVACSNAGGFHEFAEDGRTALVSEAGESEKLSENIIRLMSDDKLRVKIAETANQNIRKFTLESSFDRLLAILDKSV